MRVKCLTRTRPFVVDPNQKDHSSEALAVAVRAKGTKGTAPNADTGSRVETRDHWKVVA